ncbi:MAG: universal stress protein [Myxococcales bacterium]|nr:universal stress protein [Myxococcales bacterium]
MLRRLVVAYDFSEHADDALAWAIDLARTVNATVTLAHVMAGPSDGPKFLEATRELARVADEVGPDVASHVIEGDAPAEALVRFSDETAADAIVVATRALGTLQRWLVGSVTDELIRQAHCPVMVVRADDD